MVFSLCWFKKAGPPKIILFFFFFFWQQRSYKNYPMNRELLGGVGTEEGTSAQTTHKNEVSPKLLLGYQTIP